MDMDYSDGINYSTGNPGDFTSAGADYSTAAPQDHSAGPAGDNYQSNDQHQDNSRQDQQANQGNQQSGGGGGGTTYEASFNANAQWGPGPPQPGAPPPYYQSNQQPGGYRPQQNAPPQYPPNYRPQPNDQHYPPGTPPSHHNSVPPNVYPPGPVPGHPPPGTPTGPQQAVPPVTPPGPMGVRIDQPIIRPEIGPPVPWSSELFGFLQDCYGCPLVILAPCITFGQIAEIMDTGYNKCQTAGIIYAFAFFLGIPCLYSYTYRTKMRHRFNLREDPLDDFCTHFWCEFCALAQEYREIRYRGIEPSLGYDMQRDTINRAMEAPAPPQMQRFSAYQAPPPPPPKPM